MKHKKSFVMIATLVTILLLAFSLAACHKTSGDDNNPDTPPAPTEFTVTFDSCGGSTVPAVKGKTVQTEPLPEKDGFDFVGWYENSDYSGNRVAFPYTISKDVKFYAKWQEKTTSTEFTLTFDSCGGNNVPDIKGTKGTVVNTEPLPEKDGFDFVGWYENSDYSGNRVTFPYTISKDVKFYAKWQEKATYAQTTLDNFEYTEADGVVTLTKYIGEKTNIILPDEANVLGSDLFSESIVESVVFTAGVKEVNKTAFYWASNLKSIEVVNENPYFSAQDGILFQ